MTKRDEIKAIVRAHHGGTPKQLDETVERIMQVVGRVLVEEHERLDSLSAALTGQRL